MEMNGQGLYAEGEQALNRKDYLKALGCFLSLSRRGMDLVDSQNLSSPARKLILEDVDRNARLDHAVLSSAGILRIFLQRTRAQPVQLEGVKCHSFCFLAPDHKTGDARVLVASATSRGDQLIVYSLTRHGQRFRFIRSQVLQPTLDGQVLDMVMSPHRKIYVSTSSAKIHQFHGVTLKSEGAVETNEAIGRLVTSSPGTNRANQWFLGIGRDRGLTAFEAGVDGLREVRHFAEDRQFTGASWSDADNDGEEDIIACSRSGTISIYDPAFFEVKLELTLPDELYDVWCADIDANGRMEILVGARSNRIYVLAVNENRELVLKRTIPVEHRVSRLQVVGLGKQEKGILVALANGKFQLFALYAPDEINRRIRDALRELRKANPEDWKDLLLHSKEPDLVEFGVDQVARSMTCQEVAALLEYAQQDTQTSLAVLSKLKLLLKPCPAEPLVVSRVTDFLAVLFASRQDQTTREQIHVVLADIVRDPSTNSEPLFDLWYAYQGELSKLTITKIDKVEHIKSLIVEGDISGARRELESLRLLGINTLKSFSVGEGIRHIARCPESSDVRLATNAGSLWQISGAGDELRRVVQSMASEVRYFHISNPPYSHLLCHGRFVRFYDKEFRELRCVDYDANIECACVFETDKSLWWVLGLHDGQVVVQGLQGERVEWRLPSTPVAITTRRHAGRTEIFVLTLNCAIYAMRNAFDLAARPVGRIDPGSTPTLEHGPSSEVNPLDFVLLDDQTDRAQFLILGTEHLYRSRKPEGPAGFEQITIGRPLSCFAVFQYGRGEPPSLVVGTYEPSLLLLDMNGSVQLETYLPDVPTALLALSDNGAKNILVGFSQGTFSRYHCMSPAEITHIEQAFDRTAEFGGNWALYTLAEKLVLIAVAARGRTDKGGMTNLESIRDYLDRRIKLLVPDEDLLSAIKWLREQRVIRDHTRADHLLYSFEDDDFRDWVARGKDQFETMRHHRADAIQKLGLLDVRAISEALQQTNDTGWLADFLLIDRHKWDRLVRLAELLSLATAAAGAQITAARREYLEFFCAQIQARMGTHVHTGEAYSSFEIGLADIKFQGFDRILVIVSAAVESSEHDADVSVVESGNRPRIVLWLTQDGKPLSLPGSLYQSARLTERDLSQIMLADSPREEFLNRLIAQVNIAVLSPFQIRGAVTSMFYGREHELQLILDSFHRQDRLSYAVIGPRRIGKTSLMRRAENEISKVRGFRTVFVDAAPFKKPGSDSTLHSDMSQLYRAVLRRLDIAVDCREQEEFLRLIDQFCRTERCRLIVFLDEVDDFLSGDEKSDYIFSKTLRALSNELGVKVLIAGFSTLYSHMRRDTSALFNNPTPLELSSLDTAAGYRLIADSLLNIFTIERSDINYILNQTAGYPNFIQFCCHELVRRVADRKGRVISREDVKAVLASDDLYDHMVRVFLENLDEASNTVLHLLMASYDPKRGRIIINREEHGRSIRSGYQQRERRYEIGRTFTPYDLHYLLELHGVNLDPKELDRLMDKFVLASVVKREEGDKLFSFTLPNLPQVFRKHRQIDETAVNYLERLKETFGQ